MKNHIPWTIMAQVGLWGSGLLVIVASYKINTAAVAECCCCFCLGSRLKMFASIFYSLLAIVGSAICFGISACGLADGPLCLSNVTLPNNGHAQLWNYPFQKRNVSAANYLHDSSRWGTCVEPKNIVVWNIILFSILLAVSSLEAVLCSFQIINAFFGCIFGR
ncbi:transmembrane 4 L6 family member 5-like [Hypanus sabinus]|uniref:transmembrane 4 L6 family member 5-like n=1 Tax=Hypanus sabinus TaxID=79690 RepID=UPI0028C49B44|nr:transmembrane 4 L6 family member 5-like [Hypanus sabinus]